MPTRIYATAEDFTASVYSTTPAPANLDRKLARASLLVDQVLLLARYEVDDVGMPTDESVRAALSAAVCAQVAWMDETGDESGAAGQWQAVTAGSVALSGRSTGTSPGDRLAPDAWGELAAAGLTGDQPRQHRHFDAGDWWW